MNRLMNATLRYLALVIPFSVLVMVLRHETVLMLFQRGRFDAAATEMTARVLVCLMAGAFAFAAQTVVVRGYYATQNTIFPAVYGTISVLASIPLYYLGLTQMGITGVALAMSLSAAFQVILLFVLWNRRSGNRGAGAVYRFFAGAAAGSVPVGIFLEWFRVTALSGLDRSTFSGCMLSAAVTAAVFLGILTAVGYGLKIPEVTGLFDKTIGRLKRR